jgi:hypothetical protein
MHSPRDVVANTTPASATMRASGTSLRARSSRSGTRGRAGFARSSAWRVGLVIAGLGLASGLARVYLVRERAERRAEIHGVWLGMTPNDVRERFRTPGPGTWRSEMQADPVLIWTATMVEPRTTASFEFHGGVLVAVRMVVPTSDPDAQGPALDVSTASVLVRRGQTDGRVEITLLARDCPTHAEEVRRLISRR